MRKKVLLLAGVLAGTASGSAAQTVPGVSSDEVRSARSAFTVEVMRSVGEVESEWKRAWEAADVRALLESYDEDAVIRFPDGERLVGRRDLVRALRAGTLPTGVSIETRQLDLIASGRVAVVSGRFRTELERDGRLEESSGSYVTVYLRDGRDWAIRSQHFHEDGEGLIGPGGFL